MFANTHPLLFVFFDALESPRLNSSVAPALSTESPPPVSRTAPTTESSHSPPRGPSCSLAAPAGPVRDFPHVKGSCDDVMVMYTCMMALGGGVVVCGVVVIFMLSSALVLSSEDEDFSILLSALEREL